MQAFCTKYASEISKNMRKLINLVEKSLKTALKLIFSMKCKIFLVSFFGQLPGQCSGNWYESEFWVARAMPGQLPKIDFRKKSKKSKNNSHKGKYRKSVSTKSWTMVISHFWSFLMVVKTKTRVSIQVFGNRILGSCPGHCPFSAHF